MRSCGAFDALQRMDDATFDAFAKIVTAVDASQRPQVELPARHGGFGLRPCAPYAPLAHIAATAVSATYLPHLVAHPDALVDDALLVESLSAPIVTSSLAVSAAVEQYVRDGGRPGDHAQRQLSHVLEEERAAAWKAALATSADRARVMSACTQPASDWMLPRPFEDDVDGWFGAAEFQALARLRLGLPQRDPTLPEATCALCHKRPSDAMGRHSLTCLSSGLRSAVHNDLRDLVFRLSSSALLGPRREELCFPPSCMPDAGRQAPHRH